MRFVVVNFRGLWVFKSFKECMEFTEDINKLPEITYVVENSKLTKAIIEGE